MSALDPAIPDLEVRITPLIRGVPGTDGEESPGGLTVIELEDTLLIGQSESVEVWGEIDGGRTARVVLSMYEWDVQALEAFHEALWIGYWRPGEEQAETLIWGQMNVSDHFADGVVILDAGDPLVEKATHHYVRRGDDALNVDRNRGRLEPHASNYNVVIRAARNIPAQQNRSVPALALDVSTQGVFTTPPVGDMKPVEVERGQQVVDLLAAWTRQATGPNFDVRPEFVWPATVYAVMDLYDHPTDPLAPRPGELGRYLAPADPDAPNPTEVVWDYGLGNDTLEKCDIDPEHPTTHVHVLDRDKAFRETSADAESSALTGVRVDWIEADLAVVKPSREQPVADTTALRELADAHVRAYGKPLAHTSIELRPDVAQPRHFGHPRWTSIVDGFRIGGQWYLGDYVLVRALKGYRYREQLVRIMRFHAHRDTPGGLVTWDVEVIPALGGTPGPNEEDDDSTGGSTGGGSGNAAPEITITAPDSDETVSGDVLLTADASDADGIVSVEFRVDGATIPDGIVAAEPYEVLWDSSSVVDAEHGVSAVATDGLGMRSSASRRLRTDNGVDPPPPSGFTTAF